MMIKTRVDFNKKIREWDGFGVNYVETCQTPDYCLNPQDYGGFSALSETRRKEIIELIFGDDGLKPGIIKMFFDPFHQKENNQNKPQIDSIDMNNYDHKWTSRWVRYFASEGFKRTVLRGDNLSIITTLYGPPGWMTKQKFVRGRDFDEKYKLELAKYYVSWAKYLVEEEKLPLRYISLHNEGEDFERWPQDGRSPNFEEGHDYNMFWPPELVVEMVKLLRKVLDANNLKNIGVSCGETTNWYRFVEWGYADAIADDEDAVSSLSLITSHGFISNYKRWVGDCRSTGVDLLRGKKPDLHAWTTSISWGKMDVNFLNDFRTNIYAAKVNALIPWACIQWHEKWSKGDPNPGTAFEISSDGNYLVKPGYYYYKQLCRAGQPGMAVCRVTSNDSELVVLAFSNNNTKNADAFIVLNLSDVDKEIEILINGSNCKKFKAYRTSPKESYVDIGAFNIESNKIKYISPSTSATTFYAL